MLEISIQDIRYGVRMLTKNPGFTLVAVLTLALGIGANTAIFSVVNSVLLAPLPYPDSSRLVSVYQKTADGNYNVFSIPNFLAWKDRAKSFEKFSAQQPTAFNLVGGDKPERIIGGRVTSSLFPLLGVNPMLGRSFLAASAAAGGRDVTTARSRAGPTAPPRPSPHPRSSRCGVRQLR